MDKPPRQLPLPLDSNGGDGAALTSHVRQAPRPAGAPRLRLISGEGQRKRAPLRSRDDLARVLVGAAGDMLLRRISTPRAHEIEQRVEKLLALFDRVDDAPALEPVLRRQLDDLEALLREPAPRPPR